MENVLFELVSNNIENRKKSLVSFFKKNMDLISHFRTEIEGKEKIGEIPFEELVDGVSITDIPSKLEKALEKYPKKAYVVSEPYGYDGGVDFVIYRKFMRVETDDELINRICSQISPLLKEIYKRKKSSEENNIINNVLNKT